MTVFLFTSLMFTIICLDFRYSALNSSCISFAKFLLSFGELFACTKSLTLSTFSRIISISFAVIDSASSSVNP